MDESRFELHRDFSLNHQKLFGRGQIIGGILSFSAIGSGTVFVSMVTLLLEAA
jgi:hypothetical protein